MEKKTRKKKTPAVEKLEKSAKSVTFSFDTSKNSGEVLSPEALAEALRSKMQLKDLKKSVKPLKVTKEARNKVAESKVVFGSTAYKKATDNVEIKGYQRLSDLEMKTLAQMDPYVSAIISTRCSQSAACGTPSDTKFKKGLRVLELKPLERSAYEDEKEYHAEVMSRARKMQAIMQWVSNCGTDNEEILDSAFAGSDRTFKTCSFRQFLEAQVRNLLTFGRCATQPLRDSHGTPVLFRPAAVETIYPVIDRENIFLTRRDEVVQASIDDARDYNALPAVQKPKAWALRLEGQNVALFTEDDMKVWYYQRQALADLDGYPMAPLELAVYMVYIHQQTLSYLKNQFVKGLATKGIINLESTNENVQLSDPDIEDFKQQFHNFATRTDNSAVTPVIAGPVKVNYTNLSSVPKDMEFLQVEEHVIRALCSSFQISPQEMGYGHLSLPQGGMTQGNKQEDVIRGEERGLRNLLDIIFEGVNEIMFENFPEAKGMFKISYVGVGEDTRDAVVSRQTAEINTTATMTSLYADSEKKETIPIGGNVPLAPIFHSNVVKYLFYWEFRYYYLGDHTAKDKPEYYFIIDVNMNQSFMALKTQTIQMQQEQAALALKQQEEQTKQVEQQTEMMSQQPPEGAEGGEPPQEAAPEEGPEQSDAPEQKSVKGPTLKEQYLAKSQELKKSKENLSSYFRAWLEANDYPLAD